MHAKYSHIILIALFAKWWYKLYVGCNFPICLVVCFKKFPNMFCSMFQESASAVTRNDSLTHCGRVTHICVSKLTIIGSDNGLSPGRRQAIIWTNAGILLIGPYETNFSEILIKIHTSSFKKMHLKMTSEKMSAILSRPQCVINGVWHVGLILFNAFYATAYMSITWLPWANGFVLCVSVTAVNSETRLAHDRCCVFLYHY